MCPIARTYSEACSAARHATAEEVHSLFDREREPTANQVAKLLARLCGEGVERCIAIDVAPRGSGSG